MRLQAEIASEIERLVACISFPTAGLACAATDGRILAANPSFCEIAARTDSELSGMLLSDLIHPDDRQGYRDLFGSLGGVGVRALETRSRLLRANGSPVWVQSYVSAVEDDLGAPEYVVALVQDITESRSDEEQNAQLFGFPHALVFVAGLDGYFKRVGAGYERLLGWTEGELLSRPFLEFVHPDDAATLGLALQHLATGGDEVINQEIRALCQDGTYRWLMGSYRPVLEEGLMYGMAVDVTERKLTEESLRESERRTRLIVDTAFEAFISIDVEGRILDWNDEAERVFGWPRDDVLGRLLADLVIPEHYRTAHAHGLENFRATGEGPMLGQRIEIEALRSDGSEFPVELTISPAPTDSTAVFNAFLRDISERKRAETALAAAKADAERASEEAERASIAKSEFLSGMSHELRTPLNAILGFAQLLQLDELGADQGESVEQIMRAGQHLLELIDELLDVTRIEQGRVSLSIEPVRVDDVVRGALELVQPLAAAANVVIRTEASEFHRHALADAQRFKQVLMNLLSNAVKYNRQGGTVTVSCGPTPGERLRIAVTDTGPGIPPEKMERLFLPFERLGAERSPVEGTGIGLSISKRLVELMGGEIGAESEMGRGSTFWLELDPAHGIDAHDEPAAVAAPGLPAGAASGTTVLYVEDNLSNLRLVERIFERRPTVRLVVAMQGQLAVDLAREHRPDLILLDAHLPDIDGDEVLQRLRADPQTENIPVVLVSAEATPAKVERFLAAGALAYLTKPLNVTRLLEVIDAVSSAPNAVPGQRAPQGPAVTPDDAADPLSREAIAHLRHLHDARPAARLADLAATFCEGSVTRFNELRDATKAGDAAATERLAHGLKGASANVGARLLPELCGRLERLATTNDLTGAGALVDAIEAELERVRTALRGEFPPGT